MSEAVCGAFAVRCFVRENCLQLLVLSDRSLMCLTVPLPCCLQNSPLLPWAASRARAPPMDTRSSLVQGQQSRCGCASRQVLQHPCTACYYLLALHRPGNNQAAVNVPLVWDCCSLPPPSSLHGSCLLSLPCSCWRMCSGQHSIIKEKQLEPMLMSCTTFHSCALQLLAHAQWAADCWQTLNN